MRLKAIKMPAFSVRLRHVPAGIEAFFAWQNGCDYRQCTLIKPPIFWQNRRVQSSGFQGRRPTMTQFDGELSPPFEIVEPAQLAGADHLQLAPFRLGLSGRIPQRLADRSGRAAPLRRFVHGRVDRRSERSRLSDRAGQLSALLCRRQPRALRARSADVHRAAAELRQHALDAGRRRARHHSARGRRRPGDLSRAAFGRRRAGRGSRRCTSPITARCAG